MNSNEAKWSVFKIKNDLIITKLGDFFRKTSLDELPQICDILLGRISLVGPRSPLKNEVDEYDDCKKHRLDVKGGLLCLWQIRKNRHHMIYNAWADLESSMLR